MLILSVLISVCFVIREGVEAGDWTYESVDSWSTNYPECGQQSQSPVDINTKEAVHEETLDSGFQFQFESGSNGSNTIEGSLSNNGEYYEFKVQSSSKLVMKGAGLSYSDYELVQFQVHFGTQDTMGSDHKLNGKQYPAEVDFVFKSASAPQNDESQYAVLGFFLQIDAEATPQGPLSDLFDKIATLTAPGSSQKIVLSENGLGVFDFFPLPDPSFTKRFYNYKGSFTTPPCSEVVQWFVFQLPIRINQNQFNSLLNGKGKDGKPLSNSFRPVQPLNGRQIYRTELAVTLDAQARSGQSSLTTSVQPNAFFTFGVLAIIYILA